MAEALDMSLDDFIRNNKNMSRGGFNGDFRGRGRGRDFGLGTGPVRRPANRAPYRPMPYYTSKYLLIRECGTQMFHLQPLAVVGGREDDGSGTKLYISNLDYAVSNEDMKVLFSDVGVLKGHSVHYDRSGRSKGTAEVVFARKVDAVAAVERYNGVKLDGKQMKIEMVGLNIIAPAPFYPNNRGILGNSGSYFRRQERGRGRGWNRGGAGGRGGTGRGIGKTKSPKEKVSAEGLDADLEKYRLEASLINHEA